MEKKINGKELIISLGNGESFPLTAFDPTDASHSPSREHGTLSFDGLISHTFTIHDCLLPSPVDVEFSNGVMVWKGTANLAALLDTTPSAKTLKKRLNVKGRKVLKLTFKRPKHKSYSGSLKITSIQRN